MVSWLAGRLETFMMYGSGIIAIAPPLAWPSGSGCPSGTDTLNV